MQHASQDQVHQAAKKGREILEKQTSSCFICIKEELFLRILKGPRGEIRVEDTRSNVTIALNYLPHSGIEIRTDRKVKISGSDKETICRIE